MRSRLFGPVPRLLSKIQQVFAHMTEQEFGHFAAEAFFDHDAHHNEVFAILWHSVCWHLPAVIAQMIREIEERKISHLAQPPGKDRQFTAIANQLKWSQFGNFTREIHRGLLRGTLNACISFSTQTQKVVVLRHNLTARTREVECKSRHLATKIVDLEDQLLWQHLTYAPDGPTHSRVY